MMAANAIKPPKTGGVRHPCLFCDSRGYSARENKEQRELLDLMSETDFLRQGNYRRERKLRKLEDEMKKVAKMNIEMEDFFTNIPHVPVAKEQSTQTEDVEEQKLTKLKKIWRRKERDLAKDLKYQRIKVNENSTPEKQSRTIPAEMWGHQTRRWSKGQPTLRSVPAPPVLTFPSNKSWHKFSKQNTSKSYSIPFRPKPLHLMVRKAYLKPPPKLPPSAKSRVAHSFQPTVRLTKCGATVMQGVDDQVNIKAREMFADALERAINSEQTASDMVDESWAKHPYYDDLDTMTDRDVAERNEYEEKPALDGETAETVSDVEESWAEHPYYDNLDTETDRDVDERNEYEEKPGLDGETAETVSDVEESWAEHPYYDDLDISVTVHDVDAMQESNGNFPSEEEDETVRDEEMQESDAHHDEEVPADELWEDHPHHDPDELAESDHDDTACQDSDEEEVAWEDSPYY